MAGMTTGEEPHALWVAFARVMSASIRGMAAAWGGREAAWESAWRGVSVGLDCYRVEANLADGKSIQMS